MTLYDEIMEVARKHGIVKIEAGIVYVHTPFLNDVWTFTVPQKHSEIVGREASSYIFDTVTRSES